MIGGTLVKATIAFESAIEIASQAFNIRVIDITLRGNSAKSLFDYVLFINCAVFLDFI